MQKWSGRAPESRDRVASQRSNNPALRHSAFPSTASLHHSIPPVLWRVPSLHRPMSYLLRLAASTGARLRRQPLLQQFFAGRLELRPGSKHDKPPVFQNTELARQALPGPRIGRRHYERQRPASK